MNELRMSIKYEKNNDNLLIWFRVFDIPKRHSFIIFENGKFVI